MGWWKTFSSKLLKSRGIGFEFLRSIVSSQAASWVDMAISFVFFMWLGMYPWLATLCGAAAGGVVNCIINYRFTFRATGCPWRAVAVKYVMVWVGSLLLNAFGTEAFYRLFEAWPWLHNIGFAMGGLFAAARLLVSLIVSLAWNFLLQRNFVYRPTRFDPTAIRISDFFWPPAKRTNND